MTLERAHWIVEREDYLPWAYVEEAKELLARQAADSMAETLCVETV